MFFSTEELLETYNGEYKLGILGKKNKVYLDLYESYIKGTAAEYYDGKLKELNFKTKIEDIQKIEEKEIEGYKSLMIQFINGKTVVSEAKFTTIVLPNLEKHDEAVKAVTDKWEKFKEDKWAKALEEQEKEKKQLMEQQKYKEECRAFYKDCYAFHIADRNNPFYELQTGEMQFAGIYIDQDKNLNFLKIDGDRQEESNACILYHKIHYYEKAGSVHYTSDINGNYSNFGGSFTGATVSGTASVLGGLLFGPMGMAAGALLTHKQAKVEMPTSSFNISSETHKIDDRSVILNYYSDAKQQLIDIELPADIFNFLQTYLPEKKYGIVLEIEKKNAVKQNERAAVEAIEGEAVKMIAANNDMDAFENRIKKLKLMYENGILSEEEFASEKKRILSEL